MNRIQYSERGQFVTFVAVALIILGLLIGIAIDGGRAYLLQSKLYKLVDPMALAGALAIAGVTDSTTALNLAKKAACDVAQLNGVDPTQCGGPGESPNQRVVVQAVTSETGPTANCSSPPCVIVSATDTMNTSFMSLGTLIGCTTCDAINVAASAVASPESISADIVLVMDDTQSMNGAPRANAKLGAIALVDAVMPSGSNVQIGLVPFRGCYDTGANCVSSSDIVSLTGNSTTIKAGINSLENIPSGSGTNVCLGLSKGREILFGAGSRPNVRRIMVILTDTANNPSTSVSDAATDGCGTPAGTNDTNINNLDTKTNNKATTLKDPDGDNVEIFVLRYSSPSENLGQQAITQCIAALVGTGGSRSASDNDTQDRNLARCTATSVPGSSPPDAAGHIFIAADPSDISSQFQSIASEILKSLRLVS